MKPKSSLYAVVLYFFLMVSFSWEVAAFSESELEKLKATKECNKCDLSGANLESANLKGADLSSANLKGANLIGANLDDANLCYAKMPDGKEKDCRK